MYHKHFGLKRSPFSIEPDPDFLWLGEKHQGCLSLLHHGILANKGFLLLTGDMGTGKTVLVRSLVAGIGCDVTVATIQDPGLTLLDFFNILSNELRIASCIDGKADFLAKFKKFVRALHNAQKSLIIIIDEAQRLTNELLDEIRMLSNIDDDNRELVNIFFVGQFEFNQVLMAPGNKALRQRITASYHLVPLNQTETDNYIRHRLKVAGTQKELFMPEAVHEIFRFSNGTPRLINILCDRTLIAAYSRDLSRVSYAMIRECAKELDYSSGTAAADIRSAPPVQNATAIEEATDQRKALIRPFSMERKWIAASVVSAVALLLLGVFFIRVLETNRTQEPASTVGPSFEIRLPERADPKDFSSSTYSRVSDDSRQGRYLPDGDVEMSSVENSFSQPPPEQPIGGDQSTAEKRTAPPGEWTSESRPAKESLFLLFFKPNSADIEDSSYLSLRQVSDFLSANPNSEVTLTSHSTSADSPALRAKLLALRTTGIRSVLTAQPNFKGKITIIDSNVQTAVEDRESAGSGFSTPWVGIRVEPGVKR
jgi:general secretion pathway protein A